jgi:stearoyl-CoA desaturase (delta-9 desaturase)
MKIDIHLIRKLNAYFWMIFFPAHLLFLFALMKVKFELSSLFLILFFWTLLSGYGVGVGLHRLFSHRSFKTYPICEFLLAFIGCLAIQGSPIFWVNIHRGYHHPHSDLEKDLHSPIQGRLWAYLLWPIMLDYKKIRLSFVNDLLKSRYQQLLHIYYFFVVSSVWILLYLMNPNIFFCFVIAQIITLHQEFCVNLFCHLKGFGYRNFSTNDNSTNHYLFGLIFWGVGYHNNHHAQPRNYNFAAAPGEFDPTVLLVHTVMKRTKP